MMLIAFLHGKLDEPIIERLIARSHSHKHDNENRDNRTHQHTEENSERYQPLAGFGLFGVDILLERLEDGKIVHGVVLTVDAYGTG
jgi:hypothetical protein